MMSDYDSNIIKPVESLQNITGPAPARRREQRSRRQQLQGENENQEEHQQLDESVDEKFLKNIQKTQPENNAGSNSIDYHA